MVAAHSKNFSEYAESIHQLARPDTRLTHPQWRKHLAHCLDGGPNRALRRQPDQSEFKQHGAYFTGARFASRVANVATRDSSARSVYYDPTCGAGDLLLAVARKLPLAPTLHQTLDDWGARLAGCDINADFLRLAKTRLILLAARRLRLTPPIQLPATLNPFPDLVEADSLQTVSPMPDADVIVMNPPFGYTCAPTDCEWATGRVNAAALFVASAIETSPTGTRIVAILPDVLRSGSRYVAWRAMTRRSGQILAERPLGLFDRWTDVDVFLFQFQKVSSAPAQNDESKQTTNRTGGIGKRFHVHVGPVVPHRHPETGPLVPYLHARSIPPWTECKKIQETRQFDGRLFAPPFVTVRRTSRPDDGKRAVATLVHGDLPVAIENHLLVCVPKDGKSESCEQLIRRLRSSKTDAWLNKHLRCRHLTTRVIAQMPWWSKP